jgi:hypothetical protein
MARFHKHFSKVTKHHGRAPKEQQRPAG